ncbi:GD13234 [Drosophila simulans]|uniref:GD13234 n=1 Tax=Drosophila simulans TaxID=7240 RepID=B4QR23_DROSI|nr:GD13234 [Drosophila simulans]
MQLRCRCAAPETQRRNKGAQLSSTNPPEGSIDVGICCPLDWDHAISGLADIGHWTRDARLLDSQQTPVSQLFASNLIYSSDDVPGATVCSQLEKLAKKVVEGGGAAVLSWWKCAAEPDDDDIITALERQIYALQTLS